MVSFNGTDALSGIDTCTNAITLSNEGSGQSAGGTCTDRAGNISVSTVHINIDKTPPTVFASTFPALNTNSWNTTDVTLSFTGADALSGIDTCTDPIIKQRRFGPVRQRHVRTGQATPVRRYGQRH
jgi:hypothetical protein